MKGSNCSALRANAAREGGKTLTAGKGKPTQPQFTTLFSDVDCSSMSNTWRNSLDLLSYYIIDL